MLTPSIFGESFLDDFFNMPFTTGFETNNLMSTDIQEHDDSYTFTIDMPGVGKDDIKADLQNGYLTIQASTSTSNDEKDDNGNYIRRERYVGSGSRSFYVGENVTENDIHAKFENGTLVLNVPKKEDKPQVEQQHYIAIEG